MRCGSADSAPGCRSESSPGVPDDDDQRRIARSLLVDLSAAADRLPEPYRKRHPEVDSRGIRAVRNFIANDYDGTDEEILWQAIAVQFPAIAAAPRA